MKIAVVDSRIPRDAERALSRYADRIIMLPPSQLLQVPVSAHPDMLLFPFGDSIITSSEYFKENFRLLQELFELCGKKPILDPEPLAPLYPSDVKFNCFTLGGAIFGRISSISRAALCAAEKAGLAAVNMAQGYAKCSACIVSENGVITEDASVEKALISRGIDVLRIASGYVALDGYDHGFIGGAGGSDSENVYFCGDIASHPDFADIEGFCRRHGKACISLGAGRLYDIGTIFFFEK